MSERINVDHAFDPEARQAQADLDAYMDSRPYEDAKGNVHAAEGGKFIKRDDFRYGESDKHYESTLEQGDYSGESLEQLAQRVAEARSRGDKTGANDAEEIFMDKFYEYAEKYGWEDEVIDESATGQMAVDKDAKIGRDTIDARLERYGKIMYGDADTTEAEADSSEEADTAEPEDDIRVEPWVPPMSAEEAESKLESVRRVKAEMEAEAEPEYDSEAQQKKMAERLEPVSAEGLDDVSVEEGESVSAEGLEPVEVAVEEGESLEEYEARTGVDNLEGLDFVEADAAGLEDDTEDEEPEARRSRRLRDRFSPAAIAARLTTANFMRNKNKREREAEDDSKERSRKKLALGLGVLTVAAVGVGVILANRYGVDYQPGNGGGNGGNGGGGAGGGGNRLNWNDFDPSAQRVTRGEGWFQTFKEMGIPKSEWKDVLDTAGPKLGKLGEAYYDNGAGEWRISKPGQLSNDALRVIANSSRRNGVEL